MNMVAELLNDDLAALENTFSFWWKRRPDSIDTLEQVLIKSEKLIKKVKNTRDLAGEERLRIYRSAYMIHTMALGFDGQESRSKLTL